MVQVCVWNFTHERIWDTQLLLHCGWSKLILNLSSGISFPSLLSSPGTQRGVWVWDNPDWTHHWPLTSTHMHMGVYTRTHTHTLPLPLNITYLGLSLSACTTCDLDVIITTRPKGNHPGIMELMEFCLHKSSLSVFQSSCHSLFAYAVTLQTIIQRQQGKNKLVLISPN